MTSAEIRRQFLDYFLDKGHTFAPSSPVVPFDDPTLLFTNAGMNQFKDVFLGSGKREYLRAVNTQKCIRAGGKHNDLDDVGHDTYHHTFFEMLGNWSFGDYFKEEAIEWAWDLLTRVWKLDRSRLHATVFEGDAEQGLEPDHQAAELWRTVTDIDPANIHFGNKRDNFWEMGDTGPCGPCSEIHIDLTPDRSGRDLVNAGDARVIEIWNLVFIQFNRDAAGRLSPLPQKHVDTGMGFERITAVLQQCTSNYDTDVFQPIFQAIRELTGAAAYGGRLETAGTVDPEVMVDVAYRVIGDHLRCLVFALSDGAVLGNEGRGYVLRRILRRAVRYGRQYLGVSQPFLCRLVPAVTEHMGSAFPELRRNPQRVAETIRDEEESFGRTYERGVRLFEEAAAHAQTHGRAKISGEAAFKLHDTYGFSIDLTMLMADERRLQVDLQDYERLMDEARRLARGAASSEHHLVQALSPEHLEQAGACDDSLKYDPALSCEAVVTACVVPDGASDGPPAVVFTTDRTCFYAEQGGQVGDGGTVHTSTGSAAVEDVRRQGDHIVHVGRLTSGEIRAGQTCRLQVSERRRAIMQNHTATHLLNWALRQVLGDHVDQKGSLVDDDKTRFDFSHPHPLTAQEVRRIEEQVGGQIASDYPVYTAFAPLEQARQVSTVRAVFGEQYPDPVRLVSVGAAVEDLLRRPQDPDWLNYAVEFCGGTHLQRSGQAEGFRIIEETGVAKGVRRVTAVTAERVRGVEAVDRELLEDAERLAGLSDEQLVEELPGFSRRIAAAECTYLGRLDLQARLEELQSRAKQFDKARARAGAKDVRTAAQALLKEADIRGQTRIIVGEVPPAGPEQIREAIDFLRRESGSAAILLGCSDGAKVLLLAAMTDDLVSRGLRAGDLIKRVAPLVGGGGGGKPQLPQAGGKHPAGLPEALQEAGRWIAGRLDD